MWYQNAQEGSSFAAETFFLKFSIYHNVFISQKWSFFRFFKALIELTTLQYIILKISITFLTVKYSENLSFQNGLINHY